MAARKNVPASEVRAWATANGVAVGVRGRLKPEVIAAFRKANKGKTYEPGVAESRTVTVRVASKDARGRNITKPKTLSLPEARAVLGAEGKRGRISVTALAAALSER